MPINIQSLLPAANELNHENIFVMTEDKAVKQDIRPLKILILNLMPNKIETETQLLRLLSNSPLQVDVHLLSIRSHISKNTPLSHLKTFYKTIEDIEYEKFDGMIVTGAPLETMDFSSVDYIDELKHILEWSRGHVHSSMFICWGALVALNYFFDVEKYPLKEKISGIFSHTILKPLSHLLRGFDDEFLMPHSRFSEVKGADIEKHSELEVLSTSEKAGVAIIANKNGRQFFITGHLEYDRNTLANEFFRDIKRGKAPAIPCNYFPNDDTSKEPKMCWKAHANLLFSNWLNYYVYQRTPYDVRKIEPYK